MNTPAHLLLGWAAFGRRGAPRHEWAALAGALAPDLSLYLLAGGSIFVLGIPPSVVFRDLYYSDLWQGIFAVDNSFVVWGLLLLVAVWRQARWGVAFAGAGLLHLALDFPLHHDDGRAHFWPLSDWIFASPVSYWDRAHHAAIVGPIEAMLCLLCAILLWRVGPSVWRKLGIAALMVMEGVAVMPGFFIDI
ncbi:cobalamin biosynthesis protein CobQ [Cognatishimia sp. SS12]|uniref:cobalamin biosynthesis protein CobQ n=1 Tax=Cognatishimia sp. SS12 TaxID=2979465 RepID=UPI00232C1A1C|nr:cobalamin biosynthesis protein CobQ [Cognatishimia sp. SS12]MDC0739674.1 cobalamin biosynthesis protein CobQ [Cognatishimia sp. SS12]